MKVGDTVSCKLFVSGTRKKGKVVFVNEKHGIYTAEFDFGGGVKYRESYFINKQNYDGVPESLKARMSKREQKARFRV